MIGVAALAVATLVSPPAFAESQAVCAQRVIRDWYTGGRVDGVYPLACYRAAIRALPADVRDYSDADRDIARAMAFARRGLPDPGDKAPAPAAAEPTPEEPSTAPASRPPSTKSNPTKAKSDGGAATTAPDVERDGKGPFRLASGADPAAQGAALPYPVIVLGALACILLASGAVGWLTARRR